MTPEETAAMTPEELAAIEERDQACMNGLSSSITDYVSSQVDVKALVAEVRALWHCLAEQVDLYNDAIAMLVEAEAEAVRLNGLLEEVRSLDAQMGTYHLHYNESNERFSAEMALAFAEEEAAEERKARIAELSGLLEDEAQFTEPSGPRYCLTPGGRMRHILRDHTHTCCGRERSRVIHLGPADFSDRKTCRNCDYYYRTFMTKKESNPK